MNAKEILKSEICKYNPSVNQKEIEKVLNKYSRQDIERLLDAMRRFGTDNIFKVILKK